MLTDAAADADAGAETLNIVTSSAFKPPQRRVWFN